LRKTHIAINSKSRELKAMAKRKGRRELLVRLAELEKRHDEVWADAVAYRVKARRFFLSIIAVRMKRRMVEFEIALTRTAAGVLPGPKTKLPPKSACFLLELFLAKADRDAIPGDMEEEFTTAILPEYGARRAHLWFWTQTLRTIATRNRLSQGLLVYGLTRLGEWFLRNSG
jgi:hypothetical protein